jgi:hypothetical protein
MLVNKKQLEKILQKFSNKLLLFAVITITDDEYILSAKSFETKESGFYTADKLLNLLATDSI